MEASASHPTVCAVVGGSTDRLSDALAAQRRQPESVVRDAGGLCSGVRRGLESGAEWIWVLDGSTVPRPGALSGLLESLDRVQGLPDPVVLAGVIVTPDGRIDESRSLWYRRSQIDIAMTAAGRRLLPIRASSGPALVHRRAAEAELPPARAPFTPGGVLEWTARMLRFETAYLVPESESEALDSGRDPVRDPRTAARLLFGPALVRFDRIRFGFELAERAGFRSPQR